MARKKEPESYIALSKDDQVKEIKAAKKEADLDRIWEELARAGYSRDGQVGREVQTQRATIRGEDPPVFPPLPGADMNPVVGNV